MKQLKMMNNVDLWELARNSMRYEIQGQVDNAFNVSRCPFWIMRRTLCINLGMPEWEAV